MPRPTDTIVVFRLSALGDVCMVVPLLRALIETYPQLRVVFVSRGFARPLVSAIPNVELIEFMPSGRHKGLLGVLSLFLQIRRQHPSGLVADLHDVLRTKMLRMLFWLSGYRVRSIDKGRRAKRLLTRRKGKVFQPLPHTIDRYLGVIHALGLPLRIENQALPWLNPKPLDNALQEFVGSKEGPWVGIAPFAKHVGKQLPLTTMLEAMQLLWAEGIRLFLMGAPGDEQEQLHAMAQGRPDVVVLAGRFGLSEELALIGKLDAMVTMDSANMHLASLVGTPVVSVWGATHPYAGFLGWNQRPQNAVQVSLECRPCSVYGNQPCFRKDYACLNRIDANAIADRVRAILAKPRQLFPKGI